MGYERVDDRETGSVVATVCSMLDVENRRKEEDVGQSGSYTCSFPTSESRGRVMILVIMQETVMVCRTA